MRFLKPFQDLSRTERLLQALRMSSSFLAIVFILTSIIGPLLDSQNFYFSRVNCSHLNLATGLYNSLRSSVTFSSSYITESGAQEASYDSSLTNSEITILTQYSVNQVSGAPQFTTNLLFQWCTCSYDIIETVYNGGKKKVESYANYRYECTRTNSTNIFDYRGQMMITGLDSIIAYAYLGNEFSAEYLNSVKSRTDLYKLVKPLLYFALVSQTVVIIMVYIIYSNRGISSVHLQSANFNEFNNGITPKQNPNLNNVPKFLLHTVALIALASFISFTFGIATMTHLVKQTKREVAKGLSDFGVVYNFGRIWFLMAWIAFGLTTISMLSWGFPLWCANPSDDIFVDDDGVFETAGEYHQYHHRKVSKVQKFNRKSSYANDLFDSKNKPKQSKKIKTLMSSIIHPKRGSDIGDSDGILMQDKGEMIGNFGNSVVEWDGDSVDYMNIGSSNQPLNKKDVTHLYVESDEDLRKLGESISRKSSVRHLNHKPSFKNKMTVPTVIVQDYQDVQIDTPEVSRSGSQNSAHYREETYDGYKRGNGVSGHSESNNQNHMEDYYTRSNRDSFGGESILDESEMNILDYNKYVSRL